MPTPSNSANIEWVVALHKLRRPYKAQFPLYNKVHHKHSTGNTGELVTEGRVAPEQSSQTLNLPADGKIWQYGHHSLAEP